MTLTVGSLFSGIGGIDLGLERAGMRVVWQVEKDEYARRVLTKHWPDVGLAGDIRRCHGWGTPSPDPGNQWVLSPVDVIAGGFPCQDISVAGKGAGIKEGTRSGLWLEFARLVRELRPRYVLVENVPALRNRGLDRVLGDLAESGYDAEWDGFSASSFGAPHQRDRLFVVAHARRESLRLEQGRSGGTDGTGASEPRRHGLSGDVADSERVLGLPRGALHSDERPRGRDADRSGVGSNVAHANGQGELQPRGRIFQVRGWAGHGSSQGGDVSDPNGPGLAVRGEQPARQELTASERGGPPSHPWASEPDVGRVAHGVPSRVDRLRCLGNAVVPQVAEFVGRCIVAHAERNAP